MVRDDRDRREVTLRPLLGWMARGGLVLLAVLAVLVPHSASAAPPPGPGPTAGFFTWNGSSTPSGTWPVSDYPGGFDVWVLPGTAHVGALTRLMRAAVAQQHHYGIDIRFRGTAADSAQALGTDGSFGAVTVTESSSETGTCSAADEHRDGDTTLGVQDVGFTDQINDAAIVWCPDVWSRSPAYQEVIALHELGHAVGLGHYPGTFDGTAQLMAPQLAYDTPPRYQQGDIDGLRYLAAQTRRLRHDSVVAGAVTRWHRTGARLLISGWALTGRTDLATIVEVRRDGAVANSLVAELPRPDVPAREHSLARTAGFSTQQVLSPGTHAYCVVGVNAFQRSDRAVLGCRTVTYQPPSASVGPTPVLNGTAAARRSAAAHRGSGIAGWLVFASIIALAAGGSAIGLVGRRARRSR